MQRRFVVLDGNEKLYRLICGAPKSHIVGEYGQVNHYNMCIWNPIRGNQFQKNSKYCKVHVNDGFAETIEQIEMRPMTRQYSKSIECTVVIEDSCKKETNVDKFHSRTAGMFYLFRSCGIRIMKCTRLSPYQMFSCI